MVTQNLNFFDKFGDNLNLDWNSDDNYWTGTVYFKAVSTYLYDNENIFILEKHNDSYKFPILSNGDNISFKWDTLKPDEFFIYDVELDTELNENFINKKSELVVNYSDISNGDTGPLDLSIPMQLNIAFNPNDEVEYTKELTIYYNDSILAKISFYGEGEDEDERFGIWAKNFGIRFNKEDANILKEYDIKEAFPNWNDLNAARKSLLVNKEHIYPYIGTYKGLSNFVNMLGYRDILHIKEYWKNINPKSAYFNKQALVDISDYLDDGKIDNMNILDKNKNIKFNKQFRKTEYLAIVYEFTRATDVYDDDGIPIVEETTDFTVDEMFYKLNHLKTKLSNEFIPINVKISDVIGEFVYFQKYTIKFWGDNTTITDIDLNENANVESFPDSNYNFIIRSLNPLYRMDNVNNIQFGRISLNDGFTNPFEFNQQYPANDIPNIIEYIHSFYTEIKNQRYPNLNKRLTWEDGDSPDRSIGAPAVFNIKVDKFTFENFKGVTFEDLDGTRISSNPSQWLHDPYYTLDNLDFKNFSDITWKITKDNPNPYTFEIRGNIKDFYQIPHFLPYTGEYKVTAYLHDFYGTTSVFSKTVTVTSDLFPAIIATTTLGDKFNFKLDNLSNVKLEDFGTSPNYLPKVNVTNTIDDFDIDKNIHEYYWYYINRYGPGKNINDAMIKSSDGTFKNILDPNLVHKYSEYWGIGDNYGRVKLSDFKDASVDSLFFSRISDNVFVNDFIAGFYIQEPQPGNTIYMSLFDPFVIPTYNTLDELVVILNDTYHPGLSMFNYEIINGDSTESQYIIHAQAKYSSKEMYQMLHLSGFGSSGTSQIGSPSGYNTNIDPYTFFAHNIYSDDLIDFIDNKYPMFDRDSLFLHAKTSDLLSGAISDPYFWVDNNHWRFDDGYQYGYLPSVVDENPFRINNIKVYEVDFSIPQHSPTFFAINNIDGKKKFKWTLLDYENNVIIEVADVPFFVWKFKDTGFFTLKVEILDNNGNTYSRTSDRMITVLPKNKYIKSIEDILNKRKIDLQSDNKNR